MNRRAVLSALGIGAIAAPAAARNFGARFGGFSDALLTPPNALSTVEQACNACPEQPVMSFSEAARHVFNIPELRDEATSALYHEHRIVTALDTDLAVNRSMSLAAKITFQRQRNVERAMLAMQTEGSGGAHGVVWSWINKHVNPFVS